MRIFSRAHVALRFGSSLRLSALLLICATLALAAIVHPSVAAGAGSWSSASPLPGPRGDFQAVTLAYGQVLAMGGDYTQNGTTTYLASTLLYDPASDTWSQGPDMPNARAGFTATTLSDGRVLVAGGLNATGYIANADIYNPSSGTWASATNMTTARGNQTATLLPNGKVLVAGGFGASGALSSCEIYDPVANTWTPAASMQTARGNHVAVLLQNGQVLVAGGLGSTGAVATAEVYDPTADHWSSAGQMTEARENATATLLPNGTVLVAGGDDGAGSLATAEVFNPGTSYWSLTGSMSEARESHVATLLADGTVLVAGGKSVVVGTITFVAGSEIYDPSSGTWTPAGSLSSGRYGAAGVLLQDGRFLVAGGFGPSGNLTSVDVYSPAVPSPSATATSPTPTSTPLPPTAVSTATPTPLPTSTPITPTPFLETPTPTPVPPTATPRPLAFNILAVRVSKVTGKPDWSLVHPSLGSVPVNSAVDVSVYIGFDSVPANSQVSVKLSVTLNGRSVRSIGLVSRISSGDVGDTWDHSTFVPRVAGKYDVTATVQVNSVTQRKSASFSAIAHPQRPKPVSFSFTRLQAFGPKGRPATSFTAGERATLRAWFSVANVAGSIPVSVTDTLQNHTASGWRPLGQPLQNGFDLGSGNHIYSFSFVPATAYGQMRIVVGVTIASHTQIRTVSIQVRA